jgi:hypothetical protein
MGKGCYVSMVKDMIIVIHVVGLNFALMVNGSGNVMIAVVKTCVFI